MFVTGHPGTTQRLETLARLKHRRDTTLPYTLYRLRTLEAALSQYSEQSPEKRRQAATDLHSAANARKAFSGQLQGLLDPEDSRPEEEAGAATARLAVPLQAHDRDGGGTPRSEGAHRADGLLDSLETRGRNPAGARDVREGVCPARNRPRLLFATVRRSPGTASAWPTSCRRSPLTASASIATRTSNRSSSQLFSPAPIYPDLERAKLTASLTFLAENLGGEHPIVKLVLAGKNPAARADELVDGTKLFDPAERKRLVEGGRKAIDASKDPMILLAKAIDAEARALRTRYETEVEEPERQAYATLADLRFKAFGKSASPRTRPSPSGWRSES